MGIWYIKWTSARLIYIPMLLVFWDLPDCRSFHCLTDLHNPNRKWNCNHFWWISKNPLHMPLHGCISLFTSWCMLDEIVGSWLRWLSLSPNNNQILASNQVPILSVHNGNCELYPLPTLNYAGDYRFPNQRCGTICDGCCISWTLSLARWKISVIIVVSLNSCC